MADRLRFKLTVLAFVIFSVIVVGLFSLVTNPGQAVGYSLSYAAGLSMIFLPCTLPLAFVIIPVVLAGSARKGLMMALMFGAGMMITFSIYGVAFSQVGSIVGLLTANVVAGIVGGLMAYIFGMSELGLIRAKVPGYSGPLPSFLNTVKGDYFKVFLFGLVLANVGVGCPNPLFYVLLAYVISSADVLSGWAIMAVHGIGRATPLIFLAVVAMLGTNLLSSVQAKGKDIRKWTAWGLVIVGIVLLVTTGLFRDWFEEGPAHEFWNEAVFTLSGGAITEDERLHAETSEILEAVPQDIAPYAIAAMLAIPLLLCLRKRKTRRAVGEEL